MITPATAPLAPKTQVTTNQRNLVERLALKQLNPEEAAHTINLCNTLTKRQISPPRYAAAGFRRQEATT